ncbi:MAG TPA: mechanosensitive ion channel domain-containing protein [Flavisolibacter sp.]|jgi:small-conductance mechanosensitive channel|nr:mechanosensitive ion channel domain-containing protein [Flavisolibacter sp.]
MQKFVQELIRQWNLPPYLWNILLITLAILIGLLLSALLSFFVRKKTSEEMQFRLGQSLLTHLTAPVSFLVPLFFFNNFIPLLQVPAGIRPYITKWTEVFLILGIAWLLIRSIRVGQDIIHNKININTPDNFRQRQIITQLIYIRRVVIFIIIILAIGAVLLTFDTMRKIGTGLLTGVGIGGIIIGFAAQRSLGNLLAGFQIAFTQPIRIDDEVIVEGEFGRIEELTLTYVVVRIWDNRRLIVPINYFIEKPFQNWTRKSTEILGTVYLYVDYTIPVAWVREELMKIIKDHPLWDKRVVNLVITDLKQEVMELRAIVSAFSSGRAFDLRCDVREKLMARIQEAYPDSLPKKRVLFEGEKQSDEIHHPLPSKSTQDQ